MRNVKAISIRQPWAWLIVNGYKPVENRSRRCNYFGELFIHASKGMTVIEYQYCTAFTHGIDPTIQVPDFRDLERGGIVGVANMAGLVGGIHYKECRDFNAWFTGPVGLWLMNAKPLPFFECRGQLAVPFNVEVPDGYGA